MAREVWQASTDSKLVMEERSIHHHLYDGSFLLGRVERNGDHSEPFVGLDSNLHECTRLTQNSLQEVQQVSAIQAALRFLPNVIIGIIVNIGTGLLVHRLRANYLVIITSILSAASPLLMAIIDPKWSWWYCVFWVMVLSPLSADGKIPSISRAFFRDQPNCS